MTKLTLAEAPEAMIVQCDLGDSEDEDNRRFTKDCQAWFGKPITHIKSEKFSGIDEVFEKRKYHAGINGAPCTSEMKVAPRLDFQLPSDIHLWGYTADGSDVARFERMVKTYPEMKQRAPLIEKGITKDACHAILERAGIRRPRIYEMGFPNGNCIGCVKASSPDYWALVRKHFPEIFNRRAEQSRRFGSRLTRINGERAFIDEIPFDQPILNATLPSCDFLCFMAEQEIG
jgi:hypothetical protein